MKALQCNWVVTCSFNVKKKLYKDLKFIYNVASAIVVGFPHFNLKVLGVMIHAIYGKYYK